MHPSPLPRSLPAPHFTVPEARAAGVTLRRLRAKDLDGSVWGVRGQAGASRDLTQRCAMFSARLPEECLFSHVTAALLWGAPLPWQLETRSALDIAVAAPAPSPHARGISGHSLTLAPSDIVTLGGLRCTAAARTWCDLGTLLSLADLVAVGDYLIHWRMPHTTIAQLRREVARRAGARGVRLLRRALALLSDRSESRPESHLRVTLTLGGLPAPRVNYVVVETETGRDLRLDLAFPDKKLLIEYQGDYHRSREQWRRDMTRRSRLEADGWYVMEINADDLRDPDELLERVLRVLARRRHLAF